MKPLWYPTLAVLVVALGCSTSASRKEAVARSLEQTGTQGDSAGGCNVVRADSLLRIRCSRRNDVPDWNRVAMMVDKDLMCPEKTAADTAPQIPLERLRSIQPDAIVAIETTRIIPDSVQRRCRERLKRVIYVRTK